MPRKKKEEVREAVIVDQKEKNPQEKEETTVVIEKTENKPYLFPRLIAYIIDIIIVSTVCTTVLFFLPENKNYDKYLKEYEQIQTEAVEKNASFLEIMERSNDVLYDLDYANVFPMIIQVIFIILYFIVFQFYNKGQTLGKKLMKLRLISEDEKELTINQVAIHSILVNSILTNILVLAALLIIGKSYYAYISFGIQMLDYLLIFVILMMILFRKDGRGLHDVLAKTKVIQEK